MSTINIPPFETIMSNAELMHSVVLDKIDNAGEGSEAPFYSELVSQWLVLTELMNREDPSDSYAPMIHYATLNMTLLLSKAGL